MDGERSPTARDQLLADKRAALVGLLEQEHSPHVRRAIESLIADVDTDLARLTGTHTDAQPPPT